MRVSSESHVGLRRKSQEDSYSVDEKQKLFIIADGMGGHSNGAEASKVAVEAFLEKFDPSKPFSDAVIYADKKVQEIEKTKRMFGSNPGTTFIAAHKDGVYFRWVSIGDSYIFHVKKDGIQIINPLDEMGGMLTQALGGHYDYLDPHVGKVKLEEGEFLLLASDGIDDISHKEIHKIVTTTKFEDIAQTLIDKVNESGGRDNITVICVSE